MGYFDSIGDNIYIHLIYLYTCTCRALYTHVRIENMYHSDPIIDV